MKNSWHPDADHEEAQSEVLVHPETEIVSTMSSLWHRLWTTPLIDLLRGRMSCRLDVPMIVGESGLPEAVGTQILDIVKRTRLSRREKAGIAGELVAHFGDGLEAGSSEDEMLEGFGDARTTAKLMRRAKLRCRAWPRRALRRFGQALGVLAVVYLVAMVYYAVGRPRVSVDYLAQMNARVLAIPEEERAWPVYREALLALDRERAEELPRRRELEPGGAAWDEAVRFLDDHQAALATARRAAAMEDLGFVHRMAIAAEDRELWPDQFAAQAGVEPSDASMFESSLCAVQIPYTADLIRLVRLFAIDAAIATERADGERLSADIEAMLGMATQFGRGPMLIEQLIGQSFALQAIDAMAEVLRQRPELLTEVHLHRLAHGLASSDVLPAIRIDAERLYFEDLLQRIYTDDGNGDGHLVPGSLAALQNLLAMDALPHEGNRRSIPEIAVTPLANAAVASRKDMMAFYNEIMDRYAAQSATPYWVTRRSAAVGDDLWSSMSFLQELRYLLVTMSTPALDRVYFKQQEAEGRRDGMLVALALEVHHRRHGDWPANLDELVPGLLPSVPRDRFTGEPLRYRIDDGEVVVYSVGRDLDDDGGVLVDEPEGLDPEQSTRDRFREMNMRAGVSSQETPDGDWILWYSAQGAF